MAAFVVSAGQSAIMTVPRGAPRGLAAADLPPRQDGWVLSNGCAPQLESNLRFLRQYPVSGVPYVRHFRMSVLWF
jgi:hypothetical protein